MVIHILIFLKILNIFLFNFITISGKKSNKKRKATSTPHLSVKNDSDRKRHRRSNKNKSSGN